MGFMNRDDFQQRNEKVAGIFRRGVFFGEGITKGTFVGASFLAQTFVATQAGTRKVKA
jgi:hypothetical protein